MDHPITRGITPLTNTERLIRWRAEYTLLTADVDNWLRAIGHTSEARAKMLALPSPNVKPQPNSISAYLRNGILLLALAVPALSMAADGKAEGCQTIASIAGVGAEARDLGVPQSEFFRGLVEKLNAPEYKVLAEARDEIIAIATIAYVLPTESQADIERGAYEWCMGGK
jgi:hypothetical protein